MKQSKNLKRLFLLILIFHYLTKIAIATTPYHSGSVMIPEPLIHQLIDRTLSKDNFNSNLKKFRDNLESIIQANPSSKKQRSIFHKNLLPIDYLSICILELSKKNSIDDNIYLENIPLEAFFLISYLNEDQCEKLSECFKLAFIVLKKKKKRKRKRKRKRKKKMKSLVFFLKTDIQAEEELFFLLKKMTLLFIKTQEKHFKNTI